MDSESCSSESLTDIKSIVYDSDLLSLDIQQVCFFFYDFGTFSHEVVPNLSAVSGPFGDQ